MVYKLETLARQRYVGDSTRRVVHDRWNNDCVDCGISELVSRGTAVGFEPDDLNTVFEEGYDYCDDCFGKGEPEPPVKG